MEAIIGIIAFVFAILNVCLFFKLWGACDDIKEIRNSMPLSMQKPITNKPNQQISLGNKEEYEGQSIWDSDMRKLGRKLSKCNSSQEKIDCLNDYLNHKLNDVKKYTLKGNEAYSMSQWMDLLNRISPFYNAIGKSIPEKYINFTF